MKKKLMAVLLVAAMVMGLSMTAMAAGEITALNGEDSKDVTVKIENTVTDPVYYVDVTWESLDFTYTFDNGTQQWEPEDHVYTTSNAAAGWNNTKAVITVANHSNDTVVAKTSFGSDALSKTEKGVTVQLTGDTTKELANAATVAYGNYDAAAKATVNLGISGIPTETVAGTTFTVGTVSVVISK